MVRASSHTKFRMGAIRIELATNEAHDQVVLKMPSNQPNAADADSRLRRSSARLIRERSTAEEMYQRE